MKILSAFVVLCAAALLVAGCSSDHTATSGGGHIGGVSAPSGGATSPTH